MAIATLLAASVSRFCSSCLVADCVCFYVRTNGAITKGFEEDVGLRTTHYTFSTNTLMNSIRSYTGVGFSGPPVSKVRANAKSLSERCQKPESRPAPVQQETRYVFLPDHDRDYLLMKATVTHTLVESGTEQGKE